jgi:lysyl-tRNA synthetase class 2
VNATKVAMLGRRAAIVRALRRYLDSEGFVEVQTPLLVRGTTPDVALDSFEIAGAGQLVTSTEYQLKRLAAAGLQRAYTLTQNFRRGERSERHNPEFTMLEWYRVGASLAEIEADAEALLATALEAAGAAPAPALARRSLRAALESLCGAQLTEAPTHAQLLACAERLGLSLDASLAGDRLALLSLVTAELQQRLDTSGPTVVVEWPAEMTSSTASSASGWAERSELVWRGLELGDGFPFLTEAVQARAAFGAAQMERAARGLPQVELDERYLAALEAGLPAGAGMAMGRPARRSLSRPGTHRRCDGLRLGRALAEHHRLEVAANLDAGMVAQSETLRNAHTLRAHAERRNGQRLRHRGKVVGQPREQRARGRTTPQLRRDAVVEEIDPGRSIAGLRGRHEAPIGRRGRRVAEEVEARLRHGVDRGVATGRPSLIKPEPDPQLRGRQQLLGPLARQPVHSARIAAMIGRQQRLQMGR